MYWNPLSLPSTNSSLSPLPQEPYDRGATIDIPLDSAKENELQAKEAELKRMEHVNDPNIQIHDNDSTLALLIEH
ncbi:hypothetical protein Lal_00047550, partial [Lupinus albus]